MSQGLGDMKRHELYEFKVNSNNLLLGGRLTGSMRWITFISVNTKSAGNFVRAPSLRHGGTSLTHLERVLGQALVRLQVITRIHHLGWISFAHYVVKINSES